MVEKAEILRRVYFLTAIWIPENYLNVSVKLINSYSMAVMSS